MRKSRVALPDPAIVCSIGAIYNPRVQFMVNLGSG
jgi:hypothetical protein